MAASYQAPTLHISVSQPTATTSAVESTDHSEHHAALVRPRPSTGRSTYAPRSAGPLSSPPKASFAALLDSDRLVHLRVPRFWVPNKFLLNLGPKKKKVMPAHQLGIATALGVGALGSLLLHLFGARHGTSNQGKIRLEDENGDGQADPFDVTKPEDLHDGDPIDDRGFWIKVRYICYYNNSGYR
jgi:hypothetical protein